MRTILIATDFSPAGHAAALYGVSLAKSFKAEVILFTAFQPIPVATTDNSVYMTLDDMRMLAERDLKAEVRRLEEVAGITIHTLCRAGSAVNTIVEASKERKVDLIITGMKANNRQLRKMFGSTVTGLARAASIPLIVVPEKAKTSGPGRIALAYEKDVRTGPGMPALDWVGIIIRQVKASLWLVKVFPNSPMEAFDILERPVNLSSILLSFNPKYEYLHGSGIADTLNEFIQNHHIDLLILLPHQHDFLERLFVKSTTKTMIFASSVPIMLLPEHR